jgi:hypothetical protein
LSREILSGGPIITADPFCRVKFSFLPRKIYFLHVPHDPLLDLYFRAPILSRRRIFSVLFISASFLCDLFVLPHSFFLPRNMCCRAEYLIFAA